MLEHRGYGRALISVHGVPGLNAKGKIILLHVMKRAQIHGASCASCLLSTSNRDAVSTPARSPGRHKNTIDLRVDKW
jgi:hypothetical protein